MMYIASRKDGCILGVWPTREEALCRALLASMSNDEMLHLPPYDTVARYTDS